MKKEYAPYIKMDFKKTGKKNYGDYSSLK